jgi:hypothetical protein
MAVSDCFKNQCHPCSTTDARGAARRGAQQSFNRMFDHVAHLGGAAFGVLYYAYGKEFWTWLRVKMGAGRKAIA